MPFIGNKPTAVPLSGDDIQDGTIGLADLSATGTKDATTFLRGDNTFATAGLSGWSEDGANNNLLPASSSAGIYLGVNSATAANLLDDYEEGTWTPTAVSGITINSTYETATYTKIGRMVIVDINVDVDVTANTDAIFGSLPFVPNEDNMVCMITINNDSATYPRRKRVKSNSTIIFKPSETLSGVQCTVKAIYKTTA